MATYLVVAAHPDDPDFGVAGTAARLARDGHTVHYLILTSGDAGSEDPDIPREELIRVYPVGPAVGNVRNDEPGLLLPAGADLGIGDQLPA